MLTLILAQASLETSPAGDEIATLAYALMGLVLIVSAIATLVVTPSSDDDH